MTPERRTDNAIDMLKRRNDGGGGSGGGNKMSGGRGGGKGRWWWKEIEITLLPTCEFKKVNIFHYLLIVFPSF